jgi:hypothetical protein
LYRHGNGDDWLAFAGLPGRLEQRNLQNATPAAAHSLAAAAGAWQVLTAAAPAAEALGDRVTALSFACDVLGFGAARQE